MGKKMLVDQFAEFSAAVVQSLPRDMEVDVAQGWIRNRAALAKVLCRAFAPVLSIDRTKRFNPAKFIREGWSIWKGPANGDGLSGAEEQDERSLALSEVNLANINLMTTLKDGEERVKGEEKLRRSKKAKHIRLDAAIFLALWENKNLIPESWKGKYVYFDGTILQGPDSYRYVLCLYWDGGGWFWYCSWLEDGRVVGRSSAVLAE